MKHAYSAPSWKKWIPVYGLLRTERCDLEGKPLIIDWEDRRLSYRVNLYYQGVCLLSAGAGLLYGLEKIVENLP